MSTPGVDNLVTSFSTLTLQPEGVKDGEAKREAQVSAVDFQYLKLSHLVDSSGALVPSHKNRFQRQLTEQAMSNVLHFLDDDKNRAIGTKKIAMRVFVLQICKKLKDLCSQVPELGKWMGKDPVAQDPRLLGEELYRLLGQEQLIEAYANCIDQKSTTPLLSQAMREELRERTKKLPDTLTIRIPLHKNMDGKTRHLLIQQLHAFLLAEYKNVSNCFKVDDTTELSGFYMKCAVGEASQRINFIFPTALQHEYVATCDALQVIMPLDRMQKPYLEDNGVGDQWAIDTLFKIVRIAVKDGKFLSKVLFRYLKEHYQVATNELEIFKTEQLTEPTAASINLYCNCLTQDPFCSKEQAHHITYLIAYATSFFGHNALAVEFVKEQIKVYPECAPLKILQQGTISPVELDQIVSFFAEAASVHFQTDPAAGFAALQKHQGQLQALDPIIDPIPKPIKPASVKAIEHTPASSPIGFLGRLYLSHHEELLRHFPLVLGATQGNLRARIANAMQAFCRRIDLPFSQSWLTETLEPLEWIKGLLHGPNAEFQRIGQDLLYGLEGHVDTKKKWILQLLGEPSGQALRFILLLQEQASVEEMTRWIQLLPQKSYLFYQLLQKDMKKWLPCLLKIDPQVVLANYSPLRRANVAFARSLLDAFTEVVDLKRFGPQLVALWAKEIREKYSPKSPAKIFELLSPFAPVRTVDWSEDVQTCFGAAASALTVKDHFCYLFHPMAARHAQTLLQEAIRQVTTPLAGASKTYLRVMARPLVQALAASNLALALEVIDLHRTCCEEITDDEVRRTIFNEFKKVEKYTEAVAGWFVKRIAFFTPRLEPAEQLRVLLRILRQFPSCSERTLVEPVQQLASRLSQSLGEFDALQKMVEEMQTLANFSLIFAPFLGKKRHKGHKGEVAEIKLLYKQGKKKEVLQRLLTMAATSLEAKELAKTLIQAELDLVPPDPEKMVLGLIGHFTLLDNALWQKLLTQFSDNFDLASIYDAVLLLYTLCTKPATGEQLQVWYLILSHPAWLTSSRLVEILRDIAFFKATTDKHDVWQKAAFGLTKSLISSQEPSLLLVAHDWLKELDVDAEYFQLGCQLLKNDSHFERQNLLIQRLAPYLEILAVDEELCSVLAPETRLRKVVHKRLPAKRAHLAEFVSTASPLIRAWKTFAEQDEFQGKIRKTLSEIVRAGTRATDAMLLKALKDYPIQMQEVLIPTLARRLVQVKALQTTFEERDRLFNEAYVWLKNLTEKASEDALFYTFSSFFVEEDRLPSECSSHLMLKSETQLQSETTLDIHCFYAEKLFQLFSSNYPRLLKLALHTNRVREALNIDFSISYYNSKKCQELIRSKVEDYPKIYSELMLRHIAEFGGIEATSKLFLHHFFLGLRGLLRGKAVGPDVKDDNCENLQLHVTFDRFYAAAYGPSAGPSAEMIIFQRPVVLKARIELIPSEEFFLNTQHSLLQTAFEMAKSCAKATIQRARIMDFIAESLRLLIDCYPKVPALPDYLGKFVFMCQREDPDFKSHVAIASRILRSAVLHNIAISHGWLEHIGQSSMLFHPGPVDALVEVEQAIDGLTGSQAEFTLDGYLQLQQRVVSWYELCCSEQYPRLLQTVKSLMTLWERHPEIMEQDRFLNSVEWLFIPNGSFIGVGRSEAGQKYAYDVAVALFETLFTIFTNKRDNGFRVLLILVLLMKRAVKYGAFNGHYDEFCACVKKIIPLLASAPNSKGPAQEQILVSFTYLLILASNDVAADKRRIDLVHEWIMALQHNRSLFKSQDLLYVTKELISAKIVEDLGIEDLEKLLSWFQFIDGFADHEKLPLKDPLLKQIEPVKKKLDSKGLWVGVRDKVMLFFKSSPF